MLLGNDLRVTRENAGWTQSAAAGVLGCSQAKINYLESGKQQQKPEEVLALLRAYGADAEHVDRMTSLAARADQETWWAPFSDVLPDWFKTFVGLEGLASAEFAYGALVLPGQLQTAEYAGALLVGHLFVSPLDAPQVVRARIARQRLTDETHSLTFRAVIEEYAVQRKVGGAGVMRNQLDHLLELMRLDNVEIRIMPRDVAVHDGLDGEFLLLDFAEARSIGYIGYPAGAIYVQDQMQVHRYSRAAERLFDAALSDADTEAFIRDQIATLDTISDE